MRWFQLPLFFFKTHPAEQTTPVTGERAQKHTYNSTTLIKNPSRGSDKDLKVLWEQLVSTWFPDRSDLLSYSIDWSKRSQKRTLASCNLHQRRVVVARELKPELYSQWLPALIYHEMCHAVIGLDVQKRSGKRLWHGKQFKDLETQNPQVAELDRWIKAGGWATAVRSDRAKRSHAKRRTT
jgi:hypothetical protein